METNKFLDELLERNNYYVDIVKYEHPKSVHLTIFYEREELESYIITYSGNNQFTYVQYCHNFLAEKPVYETVFLPTFVVRIYIFIHIMKRLQEKKLLYQSIRFYNIKERVEKLNDLIPDPILKEDVEKELILDQIIALYIKTKRVTPEIDKELKELQLYHVFYMLKGLII